ncbi:MAG: ABC transporter permease [Salinivirgaceae bacterium]|jgi:ABC-2 type transport system permease protein|nr:ABC transporter permease [Salinivirgaceae bacterium]
MRTIIFLLQKEFRQIRRNKVILPIIFVLPIIQLLILVHATTFEIKNVKLCIVDYDQTNTSHRLVHKLEGSSFFKINSTTFSLNQAKDELASGNAEMIVVIPQNFSKDLIKQKRASVQFIPDAINSNFATLAYSYAANVIRDFNVNLATELVSSISPSPIKTIKVNPRFWYNPELNYKWYMFPGIMVILISMIGIFISGLNVVREKEIGTSEQLNVTPMKKYHFIVGKLLPFLIIGLFELILATTIGRIFFNVPLVGSIWVLLGFTFVYLLVVLGIGLFISTMAETQQQMMFIGFFAIIVFILLSGIFTPIESMPIWVQKFNIINPIAYFMKVLRMVMLKGSGFINLLPEFISLSIYAVIILSLATWRYRKTS